MRTDDTYGSRDRRVIELPLFPLHTVLFPGMPLRLHIFEPRYKQLVQFCLQQHLPFGVVLIADGMEAGGPMPEPHDIGCTARISYIEPAGKGRSNLLAIGGDRFRVRDVHRERAFLTAHAEPIPFEDPPAEVAHNWANQVRPLLARYLDQLNGLGVLQSDPLKTPSDPLALASFTSTILQIPNADKQALLASDDGPQFLDRLGRALAMEVALLDRLSERGLDRLNGSYTLN